MPESCVLLRVPAKPCFAAGPDPGECTPEDVHYSGRHFAGACVPANLVAGPTADDEACALAGFWFAVVAGAPAAPCDVSALPAIR